jgi:methyltransferase
VRILLVWPRNERAVLSDALSCCEPLPLEYLAGALKQHHDVAIYDERLDPPIWNAPAEPSPDLVGIAVPFTTSSWAARALSRKIRRRWPRATIVLGGHHPTVSSDWLDGYEADYVVLGEGAEPLCHLVGEIERRGVCGVAPGVVPYNDRLGQNDFPKLRTFNEVPAPDRTLLARNQERYFHSIYNPVALMRFSVGCPYQCSFCVLWRMTERRYVTKEIPRVVSELADISVENVYVVDDEAFIQPQRMLMLADAIDQSGIHKRYHMYVRTDTAVRHPDVIARWAEIGLDSVLVGAESMSDSELQDYAKGTTVTQTDEAVRLFHGLGIKVRANFIVRPEYTREDFTRLSHSVEKLNIDLPTFAVLTPLPGTRLHEEWRPRIVDDNPDLYDCYHSLLPTRLPLKEFYGSFANLLRAAADRGPIEGYSDASVFYYSTDGAFERMLSELQSGPAVHQIAWRSERTRASGSIREEDL